MEEEVQTGRAGVSMLAPPDLATRLQGLPASLHKPKSSSTTVVYHAPSLLSRLATGLYTAEYGIWLWHRWRSYTVLLHTPTGQTMAYHGLRQYST